ncbi:hypothetical protein NC651_004342 [Populus alba x Populus x berolinensis]|nr:hypothetical protein NC651_004342 [Populus alba x Populus x berolinensis]
MSLPMPNFQLTRPFIDVLDHLYMLLKEKEQRKIIYIFFFCKFCIKNKCPLSFQNKLTGKDA